MILRAFRYRNYRLYFTGQGISQIGNWSTLLATSWLVYQLTDSAWWLGVVGFASRIPALFISPIAGVIADRCDRQQILLITQILSMIQSLMLAGLALSNVINVWQIMILGLFQGIVNALYLPTLQAFVKEIIEQPEDLGNAIALNSSLVSSARIIGPAVAGFLLTRVGVGICFLLDGVSYLAVIASFLAMKLPTLEIETDAKSSLKQLKSGFNYAYGNPAIRPLLLLLSLLGFVGLPYVILTPIFAEDILGGSPETLGMLMTASALGALIASVYLSNRSQILGLEKAIAFAPGLLGISFILFSQCHILPFALPVMIFIGLSIILQLAATTTLLQTIVDDTQRGRLMSMVSMAFMGIVPFGNLFSGWLASHIGVSNTFAVNGLICLVGSFIFQQKLSTIRKIIARDYSGQ